MIEQGTPGTSFFVIANGELEVFINDKSVPLLHYVLCLLADVTLTRPRCGE